MYFRASVGKHKAGVKKKREGRLTRGKTSAKINS